MKIDEVVANKHCRGKETNVDIANIYNLESACFKDYLGFAGTACPNDNNDCHKCHKYDMDVFKGRKRL